MVASQRQTSTPFDSPPLLRVESLSKTYSRENVLSDVSLLLNEGQTLSVLGRSGSGKTTLLKIIAGLEPCDSGQIFLREKNITNWKPQRRNIVYLYQEPLLLPHLNLADNLGFGLRLQHLDAKARQQQVAALVAELQLQGHEHKMPHQLSGGQRQRVSFGRAVLVQPSLLLLDEPFGALDVEIRADMQNLFQRLSKARGIPALFVTHDIKEALLMGDHMALMQNGKLKTYATKAQFIQDPDAGVQRELAFWNQLRNHAPKNP